MRSTWIREIVGSISINGRGPIIITAIIINAFPIIDTEVGYSTLSQIWSNNNNTYIKCQALSTSLSCLVCV